MVIPPEVGGFYIKTAGIYCDDGSLFAVARLADTYKPLLNEGSSKDITLNFKLQIANANDSIVLKVDNNVVLATRKWSDATFLKKTEKIDAYTKKESDKKFALKDDLPDLATDEKAGVVKIKNIINAKQTDTAVTEKAVAEAIEANKGLGVGQTYKKVWDQRDLNTYYPNTTNKPILVCVSIETNNTDIPVSVIVDEVMVLTSDLDNYTNYNFSFIVPAGSKYKLATLTNPSYKKRDLLTEINNEKLNTWSELS